MTEPPIDLPAPPAAAGLSHSQVLMWTGQQLSPGLPLYNMVLAFEIEGELDAETFRRAFGRLVDGSDALRSGFVDDGGTPQRVEIERTAEETDLVDLSNEPDRDAALAALVDARATAMLDVGWRAWDSALVRLGPARHVWVFTQHHLIADAWSTAVCFRRLGELYAEFETGDASSPGESPAFLDFVEHEQRLRDTPAHRRAREHWEERLADAPEPTSFYGGVPRTRSARTERVERRLGVERTARLRALAERPGFRGLTPDLSRFQILASVLFALLHRIGGEREDLAILAPVHNRSTPAFRRTVGLFVEVLPLQVRTSGDDTFEELVRRVARQYRDFLVHALPGTSAAPSSRGCDVLLNYIPSTFGDFAGRRATSRWVHPGHGDPAHALRIQVHDFDESGDLVLHFDMSRDAFGPAERRATARHFLTLLDALLDDPSRTIADVDLVTEDEREARLVEFNDTEREWPHATVVEAFAAQVRATPDRQALRSAGEATTYDELDARSSRLANYIAGLGAGRGDVVAILLDRSPAFVEAALAVLRSGAAYLPVDPTLPPGRVEFLLDDARSTIVVSNAALASRLPASETRRIVLVDDEAATIAAAPATVPVVAPAPDDLAYVIYTSGSSGRPKGVEVSHAALANYAQWARETYASGGRPTDFALFTPVSVDLTVTSIFVPLLSGGAIEVYAPTEGEHDLAVLQVFEDDAVDVVKLTPAHLEMLLRGSDLRSDRLRALVVGGEDLKRRVARRVQDALGERVAIYNEYGPTEATVGCMIHRHDGESDTGASVPIGRPVANARIYLLDDRMRVVPAGVPGEVWIGGVGVARGYLGDAAQTTERFVESPFVAGDVLYRSGDVAREDPATGSLTYLGRADRQVKIRGARVELAEVQAALERHPGVREAHVDVAARTAGLSDEERARRWANVTHCVRCGLASNHPDAHLDDDGVCAVCHEYDSYKDRAEAYFRPMDELRALFDEARRTRTGDHDCVMLLSGGKDSTYALYQLVAMGLDVLVFSLDNGYISDSAKANIRRVVDDLGLELVFAETPSMNAIFADSLRRFSNVCQGCFKTIYTLGTKLAEERGIRHVVTGLSRGQIFETRLADLFRAGVLDPDEVDRTIVEARKAYHRIDDAVSRQLDVELFADDAVFEDVRFVDFYRYCDEPLSEVLRFIAEEAAWVRPADTGRSTNCLINDTGIFFHKHERGFHNYALPYSWDVRLGHKTRQECLDELDDEIDEDKVHRTLREVGVRLDEGEDVAAEARLVAYVVPSNGAAPTRAELASFLADELPQAMVPSAYVALDALPLTSQGKVDRDALPDATEGAGSDGTRDATPPRDATEETLADVWCDVLGLDEVGVHEDFIAVGGDSILAIQVVSRARGRGLSLQPKHVFAHPTIAELAQVAAGGPVGKDLDGETGPFAPTPIQRWFLDADHAEPDRFAQTLTVESDAPIDAVALERALGALVETHDALRLAIARGADGWTQVVLEPDAVPRPLSMLARDVDSTGEITATLDASAGGVLRAGLVRGSDGAPDRVVLVVHHVAVDAVSWSVLLEDLERAYVGALEDRDVELTSPSSSWSAWARAQRAAARSDAYRDELATWTALEREVTPLPRDRAPTNESAPFGTRATECVVERTLDADTASALRGRATSAAGAGLDELLLAAFAASASRWAGGGATTLQLDVEGHGRDAPADGALDASRMVGWCTTMRPVQFRATDDARETLDAARARLRALPDDTHGYGLLRTLSTDAGARDALRALPRSEVLFNFLGRASSPGVPDGMFRVAAPLGVEWSPLAARTHALEVVGVLDGGRLVVRIGYSEALHDEATIERLADGVVDALQQLADAAPSPSDFPNADVSQSDLDDILNEFGG